MSTTVGEIVNVLKGWAPLSLKESWDNPGLLIGSPDEKVDKLMVTLDVMMGTVDYAIEHGIQMIVSHHPVIFDGLKSLRTDTYSGRLYQKLLAHHISVYSAHTNLDSADGGVNDVLARLLGLTDLQGLVPVAEDKLYKIAVYVPESHGDAVRQALADAGAGLTDRIDCRLGDGLTCIQAGEVDGAVICGMGGPLMVKILQNSYEVWQSLHFAVLQPQSEAGILRRYLYQHGWHIEDERLVIDDGRFYEMMRAVPGQARIIS